MASLIVFEKLYNCISSNNGLPISPLELSLLLSLVTWFFLCNRSYVGVACIFVVGWVVLEHLILKQITKFPKVNNVVVLPYLVKLSFYHLKLHVISNKLC